jgi:mono/diheme cytochrome c family protein
MLATIILLAVVAVACGRASKDDINSALGITPTATLTAEQQDAANARATDVASGNAASPSAGDIELASLGNATTGRTAFLVQCQRCHTPGGNGPAPALTGGTNPAANLNDGQLYDLMKAGTNHDKASGGPGPIGTLTDKQIYDIIAFLRSQP